MWTTHELLNLYMMYIEVSSRNDLLANVQARRPPVKPSRHEMADRLMWSLFHCMSVKRIVNGCVVYPSYFNFQLQVRAKYFLKRILPVTKGYLPLQKDIPLYKRISPVTKGYPPRYKRIPPVTKGYPPLQKDTPRYKRIPPITKGYPPLQKGYLPLQKDTPRYKRIPPLQKDTPRYKRIPPVTKGYPRYKRIPPGLCNTPQTLK